MKNSGKFKNSRHFGYIFGKNDMSSAKSLWSKKIFSFCLPFGKARQRRASRCLSASGGAPHLLRCQGLAVDDYSVALGRLKAGATSTIDQLGIDIFLML